jgi:hypothetical protein
MLLSADESGDFNFDLMWREESRSLIDSPLGSRAL